MAGDTKGFLSGGMKFGTGDEAGVEERGPILPLRFVVVADLVPRGEHNAGASAPEASFRLDPARFDELFTKLRPRIAVEVPSVLADGKNARVDLAPTGLKSFRPDGLITEVPLLRSLMDGRLVLERLRDGSITPETAHTELNRLWQGAPFAREVLGLLPIKAGGAPPPAPAPAASSGPPSGVSIDALLAQVDVGDGSSSPAAPPPIDEPGTAVSDIQTKFSNLIAQVAHSGKSGAGVRPTEAISRVEKAVGVQIGAILQHPEVRRLERAYRGVKLFSERAQGHTGIKIEIVSARPDDAEAALVRTIRTNAASEPPVSCAIVDVDIDGTAVGFARLESISNAAEAYGVPVILNGTPKLLGVDDLKGIEHLDHKGGLFEKPQQAPWRAAVGKPATRWVTIAMNAVLARAAYDKTTARVREAAIKELPDDDGAIVWIAPAYAVGTLILTSFRDTQWPCRIIGPRSGGVVENLPVREVKSQYEGDEGVAIPTEAFVSTDSQREMSRMGVLLLASAPNSDQVYVMNAPTAYVTPPKKTYDSASTEPEVRFDRVSLGDQLFVARISQFLRALCAKIPANSDPAEVQPVVEAALWTLFENAPPASVELVTKAKRDGGTGVVEITVRPRRFLGVAIEEVSMEVPLG